MTKTYKYQLIILGSASGYSNGIVSLFNKTVQDLNMSVDSFRVITSQDFSNDYEGNQPAFVVYFGDKVGSHQNLNEIETLKSGGATILPVFFNSFSFEVPQTLGNQNGMKFDPSQQQKIVNLALEHFGKLRHTRKIFISYKRNESTSVAIQLYEALEANNFDVFLDTHSIKPAEPFQEELWHRMTDCDVIVLLNTPGFLNSEWCKEEIAMASAKQIGVLQLVWPQHELESTNEVCVEFQLNQTDFEGGISNDSNRSKLLDLRLKDIVNSVESLRARNLAARQNGLITEFLLAAKKTGKTMTLQPERIITEELDSNKRRLFVPSVGIPQSIDCNQSEEIKKEIKDYDIDTIHLIYDDLRIRDKWLSHLEWLNKYLDVKTIKKQEFDTWLKKN